MNEVFREVEKRSIPLIPPSIIHFRVNRHLQLPLHKHYNGYFFHKREHTFLRRIRLTQILNRTRDIPNHTLQRLFLLKLLHILDLHQCDNDVIGFGDEKKRGEEGNPVENGGVDVVECEEG